MEVIATNLRVTEHALDHGYPLGRLWGDEDVGN